MSEVPLYSSCIRFPIGNRSIPFEIYFPLKLMAPMPWGGIVFRTSTRRD